MDLGSVIIGIVTLACFILPIVYLQNSKKREKKKFLKDFILLAEHQQLTLTQYDFWNHGYAIGLDPQKNKLFYLKKKDGKEQKATIDLSEVTSCRIINVSRTEKDYRIVDSIQLALTFRNPKQGDKILDFYDKEESMAVHDEHQFSEKWNALINAQVKIHPLNPSDSSLEKKRLKSA